MTSTEVFINKANTLHGDTYVYNMVEYVKAKSKVIIRCPSHGYFKQTPNDHLSGKGCKTCARERTTESLKSSIDKFKAVIQATFGDVYNYPNAIYVDYQTPIEVVCKACNATILGKPTNLLKRKNPCGCTTAKFGGFKKDLPAILYYIKVEVGGIQAYKIGITNKTVMHRFRRDLAGAAVITTIKQWDYSSGEDAFNEELRIKRTFKEFQLQGISLLIDGNSELFSRDILELEAPHECN